MSRIRTVKPDLFRHEDLFDAEMESGLPLRLAFIGLFTVADCAGRFIWKPRTLKLDVLPHDSVDFSAVLNALEAGGFIQSYTVNGQRYGYIPSFGKHQQIPTREIERGSALPPPAEKTEPQAEARTEHEPVHVEARTEHCPEFREVEVEEEGKGKGKEEETAQAPFAPPPPPAPPMPAPPMPEPEPAAAKPAPAPTPKAARQPKPIKAPIPADWMPAETTYALLEKHGMTRAFAEDCIDEFRLYWQERGESRVGWEATFVNNAKRQWERRPSPAQSASSRPGAISTPPSTITPEGARFDAILRGLNGANTRPAIEGECYATH